MLTIPHHCIRWLANQVRKYDPNNIPVLRNGGHLGVVHPSPVRRPEAVGGVLLLGDNVRRLFVTRDAPRTRLRMEVEPTRMHACHFRSWRPIFYLLFRSLLRLQSWLRVG